MTVKPLKLKQVVLAILTLVLHCRLMLQDGTPFRR